MLQDIPNQEVRNLLTTDWRLFERAEVVDCTHLWGFDFRATSSDNLYEPPCHLSGCVAQNVDLRQRVNLPRHGLTCSFSLFSSYMSFKKDSLTEFPLS
jgi:hypothetical protein